MGTNFYWIQDNEKTQRDDSLAVHIGKRSAAGWYCFDCGTTFSRHTCELHFGQKSFDVDCPARNYNVSESCPGCGKKPDMSSPQVKEGGAMLELGFSKTMPQQGITPCCSFTWTLMKHRRKLLELLKFKKKVVVSEYGDQYTAKEFLKLTDDCPIQFQSPCQFS